MQKYIARRVLLMFPTLFILSLLVFGLMRVLPGDVAMMILSAEGGGVAAANEKALQALREELGLTEPLHIQYLSWVWDVLKGDFGRSLLSNKPVVEDLLRRLPITVQLTLMGMGLSLLVGIPIGIISAIKQNSFMDLSLRFIAILLLTAPSFWVGLLVIMVGARWFNWIPPVGYNTLWEHPKENLAQMIWPALILAHGGLATMARMTRSTMLEVLREDYIRTARAKGLQERTVIIRHALKNALIPVVTLAGLTFGTLLGGTVILEFIFGIPGMGSWWIRSILDQDYPVVQSLVLVFGGIFMLVNLGVDLLYGWLDPRIAYS